jgi:hypothetical protein
VCVYMYVYITQELCMSVHVYTFIYRHGGSDTCTHTATAFPAESDALMCDCEYRSKCVLKSA